MKKVLGILFAALVLMACNKKTEPGNFTINLSHIVGSEALNLNQRTYESPAGHTYDVTTYQYYLSDISLVTEDGTLETTDKGFLVDAEDASSYTFSLDEVAAGTYNKIQFQYGFSKENNFEDYLVSTVENQSMFWPAQMEAAGEKGDYHYMKLEGNYDSLNTGTIKSYLMHSGPTNGADNSFTVQLPLEAFEINDNSAELNIKVDLKEWIQNPTTYNFAEWRMVMMNQNAQDIYKANGQTVFSAGDLTVNEK